MITLALSELGTHSPSEGKTQPKAPAQKATAGFYLAHALSCVMNYIIVDAALGFQNATDALAFYGVYHREPFNQFIHFFGVPGIIWSGLIFMVHLEVPLIGHLFQNVFLTKVRITYGLLLTIFYLGFYLQIDPIGGTLYAPVLYIMYASAVYLMEKDQKQAAAKASSRTPSWNGTGRLLIFALVVHFLCWYVQIHLGHHIFEGAKPAVLQSLGGALTVAPLFAFYEGVWLLGINTELQKSTALLVEKYTHELCATGTVAMRACESLSI